MLRYETASPGLVALYDIRPGNGAGPFLQPAARTGLVYVQVITVQLLIYPSVRLLTWPTDCDKAALQLLQAPA